MPAMSELCTPCSELKLKREDFTSSPLEPEGRYNAVAHSGTFGLLRRTYTTCGLCKLIFVAMDKSSSTALADAMDEDTWTLRWAQNTNDYQPDNETENVETMFESALYPCFGDKGSREDYGIQLIDDKNSSGFLRGRLIGDNIDIKAVTGWIDKCTMQHGDRCRRRSVNHTPLSPDTHERLTVIDVEKLCLCKSPANAQYAALSYVWGDTNWVVTNKDNVAAFQELHGLDIELPRTVRDAIEVTKALGIEFVWIDALCIQQDDYVRKKMTIGDMDAIYANAIVTIVASTSSGADSGLSGWSAKANRSQHCVELSNSLCLGVLPYYQRELLHCEHIRRAWTYQETCLSPRCLAFLNGFVYLNCNAAVYCEQVNVDVPGIAPETSANSLGKTDDLYVTAVERYGQHVRAYTSRALTYESDISNAFGGILAALTGSLQCRNIPFGMPSSCFDWAILWRGHGPLRRRVGFPSWSWMGWVGEIEMSQTHDTDYDQMWLLQGTWINWQRHSKGTAEMLWGPKDTNELALARVQCIMENVARYETSKLQSTDAANHPEQPDQDLNSSSSEDSAADDERDWREWSPIYGMSTLENPFGRILEQNEAVQTVGHSTQSIGQRFAACKNQDLQALCFSARTTTLSAGRALRTTNEYFLSALYDGERRTCGSLSIHDCNPWSDLTSTTEVKLLLISVTPFGALKSHNGDGCLSAIGKAFDVEDDIVKYLEGWPRSLDYFDFLNVLFVLDTGQTADIVLEDGSSHNVPVYERAGVGFIYRKALSDIVWENIVLA